MLSSFPLAVPVTVPTSHWDGSLAVDLFAPDLTPVLAVFDGYADAYTVPLGGNAISLTAADGTTAYYAHLAGPGRSGWVQAGDVIGYEGHSGNADKANGAIDSHLHFALASSPGVIAERNGSGDIAPWTALLGSTLPGGAPSGGDWRDVLGPTLPAGGQGPAPGSSGVFGGSGVRWGPVVVVGGLVLLALGVLDD